jgi:hypothetical protein
MSKNQLISFAVITLQTGGIFLTELLTVKVEISGFFFFFPWRQTITNNVRDGMTVGIYLRHINKASEYRRLE